MMTPEKLDTILKGAGFSKRESDSLISPKRNQYDQSPQDLNELWKTGLIQKAIKSRVKYIHQCRDEGWSNSDIKKSILQIDRNLEANGGLFQWLSIEYAIPANKSLSYKVAVKNRARTLINRTAQDKMGIRYGKRGYQYRHPTVPYKVAVRPVNQPSLPNL